MKKVLSIALALTLVLCLALSASAAATCYMDMELTADGQVSDKMGNAEMTHVTSGLSTIGDTEVTHKGQKYTVPAFVIDGVPDGSPSDYIMGYYSKFKTIKDYYALFQTGMTVELFFQNTADNAAAYDVDSVPFGNANGAGWGFFINSTKAASSYIGGVRFIVNTGTEDAHGWCSVLDDHPIYQELTHLVGTTSYDAASDTTTCVLYVNGAEAWSESKAGQLFNLKGGSFGFFGIGCNYVTSATGAPRANSGQQCKDLIVVDAKMYSGAATADEVKGYYDAAVKALSGTTAPTTTPTATPTTAPTAAPTQAPTTAPTTTPSTPSTGDTGVVAFLAIMAIMSMATVMVVAKKEH